LNEQCAATYRIAEVRDPLSTQGRPSPEWASLDHDLPKPLAEAVRDVTESRQTEAPLRDKIRFLQRPDSYRERPRTIEVKESPMSWVLLTDEHAYTPTS
jgi:hypothetical protein